MHRLLLKSMPESSVGTRQLSHLWLDILMVQVCLLFAHNNVACFVTLLYIMTYLYIIIYIYIYIYREREREKERQRERERETEGERERSRLCMTFTCKLLMVGMTQVNCLKDIVL